MYKCSQSFFAPKICCLHVQTSRKTRSFCYFKRFWFKFSQIWVKSLQNSSAFHFFIIQSEDSARGRSNKRLWASFLSSLSSLRADFTAETINFPCKQTRKSLQLPQFRVYKDVTSRTYRVKDFGQNESTPSLIGRQINKIWSYIAVEISFQPEFHLISIETSPERGSQQPLVSLSSIALNGAQRVPQIPQDWLKNQPNNHISTFFSVF